jgi:hypothetical protein
MRRPPGGGAVPRPQRLCVACGLGMFGDGDVHEDSSLEFENKRACTELKMLRAAVAMWRFKRRRGGGAVPVAGGRDGAEIPDQGGGGRERGYAAHHPLTIRMGVWSADSVAGASPAQGARRLRPQRVARRWCRRTPAGVTLCRPGAGSTGSGRASDGAGHGGPTAAPTSRTLFPGT